MGNLPSSSFHLCSVSLSHFAPASLTRLYPFTTKPKLSSLLSLSHFALLAYSLSRLPPFISLPVVSPLLTISTPSPLPPPCLSFTDDLGSHSLSLTFMKLLMLFPASASPPPCAQLSLISLSGCIPSPHSLVGPIPYQVSSVARALTKKEIKKSGVIFSDSPIASDTTSSHISLSIHS